MESEDLYAFLGDPNLIELIEQNKTTDDLLDVFNLTENQHSDVLAWCMNPNEGHSQGDAVIKDFLEAGYTESADTIWDNRKFFTKWTPGKIRTTSFGAAFVTRELSIRIDNKKKNGRLDLFLVDPQNKVLIAIENKAGARLTAQQLEKYVQSVRTHVASNKTFADYDLAFIVLDRDLEAYSTQDLEKLGKRWTLLDYSWLAASAKRARFQLAHDRKSAQLLVAYCQRQTEWESTAEKRTSELAADLTLAHPKVIEAMRMIRRKSLTSWSLIGGPLGELTLFQAQHAQICGKLIGIRSIATIVQQLTKAMPTMSQDHIETGRTWLSVAPIEVKDLMQEDDSRWPIYVNLYRVAKASRPDAPKFNLRLIWVRSEFNPSICDEAVLRTHFETDFSGLKTFATSDIRRLLMGQHLSAPEAIVATKNLLDTIGKGIRSRPALQSS